MINFYEAMLAALASVIWNPYSTVFNPHVCPVRCREICTNMNILMRKLKK